jgi:Swi5-dependent recombination DNA repair protein 1
MAFVSKRRRLDEAASTLSRPFKSPLRTPSRKPDEHDKSYASTSNRKGNSQNEALQLENKDTLHAGAGSKGALSEATTNDAVTSSRNTPYKTSSRTNKNESPIYSSPSSRLSDPAVFALQKQHNNLQSQLSALRSVLDTVQQALRIESSGRDQELEALISKWRSVSQEASEELFAAARERVHRMGGVAAWREQMRKSQQRWHEEDHSSGREALDRYREGIEQEDDEEEDGEKLKKRKAGILAYYDVDLEGDTTADGQRSTRRMATALGEHWQDQKEEREDESSQVCFSIHTTSFISLSFIYVPPLGIHISFFSLLPQYMNANLLNYSCSSLAGPQSFTMDMMLASLNIELDVIGFDKHNQQWVP